MPNSMHVKLEHEEMIAARKVLLSSEINLLKILQYMKNYNVLRKKETSLKTKFKTKLRKISSAITIIQKEVPKISDVYVKKIQELEKLDEQGNIIKQTKDEKIQNKTIESEILEIRRKLIELEHQ